MSMNANKKNLWIGIGIGAGVGGAIGTGLACYFTRKSMYKKYNRELPSIRRKEYSRGYNDCFEDEKNKDDTVISDAFSEGFDAGFRNADEMNKKWIEENMIIIENPEDPESTQKAINDHIKAKEVTEDISKAASEAVIQGIENSVSEQFSNDDPSKTPNRDFLGDFRGKIVKDMVQLELPDGETVLYPRYLFFDKYGEAYPEVTIRSKLRDFEQDIKRLKKLWIALGYGEYNYVDSDEDINNWDLSISEDADLSELGDEPEIKSKEREEYMEQIKRYRDNPEIGPEIVSRKVYEDDNYLDHITVDYYDVDNVFVDNQEITKPIDAVTLFGVANGQELFGENKKIFPEDEDDNDPEIVYIRNIKMHTIAEITRSHMSYASIKDGSAYLDGSTDQYERAEGM